MKDKSGQKVIFHYFTTLIFKSIFIFLSSLLQIYIGLLILEKFNFIDNVIK